MNQRFPRYSMGGAKTGEKEFYSISFPRAV